MFREKYKKPMLVVLSSIFLISLLVGYKKQETQSKPYVSSQLELQKNQNDLKIEKSELINNVSYTIGYDVAINIADTLKKQNTLNQEKLLLGFKEGVAGVNSRINLEEMKNIMEIFQKNLISQQKIQQLTEVISNPLPLLKQNHYTPVLGSEDAKITVIEFFDYNCIFCKKVNFVRQHIFDANKDIKWIFKSLPLSSNQQQWEMSQYAEEVGISIFIIEGIEGYLKYHHAIFSADISTKLSKKDINDIANTVIPNFSIPQDLLKEITNAINNSIIYGISKIGIQETPTIIIMPSENCNSSNTTIISGFISKDSIQDAIDKARE